jgi:Domain of unknown function (DUF6777)
LNASWFTVFKGPGPWYRRAGIVAAAAVVIVGMLVAVSAWAYPHVVPIDVAREPISTPGANPFTPPVGIDVPAVASSAGSQQPGVTPPPGGAVAGDTPGLYGGTRGNASCDREKMLAYLRQHPDKAAAWAEVLGIKPEAMAEYVATLTPVILRVDTYVTNHGFAGGRATAYPAVLQAGTAVLVDERGMPVVKCYCGNPLTAPPERPRRNYVGPTWPAFSPNRVTTVRPADATMDTFTLVDPKTNEIFDRPSGTAGERDQTRVSPPGPQPSQSTSPGPQPSTTSSSPAPPDQPQPPDQQPPDQPQPPPPQPQPPAAPVLSSPADGSLFFHYPRETTLQWQAVTGAAQYDVEIQCDTCDGQWSTWRQATVTGTSYAFTWVGDNQGRWRVTAIAPNGTRGPSSGFWYFRYDTAPQQLPAPTGRSPADGTVFSHYPRTTTLSWNAVTGAAEYEVYIECLHCIQSGQWGPYSTNTVTSTSYTFNWVGAQPGRWRVTAIAGDGTRGITSTFYQFSYTV